MKKNTLLRLISYVGKNKSLIGGAFICAIISVISSLMGPIIIGKAIDNMIGLNRVNFKVVISYLIFLGIVYALGCIFTWLLTYITNGISYKTSNLLRRDLFKKINNMPLRFYDKNSHGDIISRFINDIDAIGDGLLQGMSALLTGIITIIGSILFMISINSIMTLVVILSAPLTFYVARFITKSSQKYFKEQSKELGKLNGYIEEIITGQKTVKAFSYENRSLNEFKKINSKLYSAGIKSQFYGSLANPSTRVVNNIVYSIIGVTGSIIAILGRITVGDISSFLIYSNLFSKPFNEITGVFTQIQSALASAERVFTILDMEEEIINDKAMELKNCQGNIKFKNVEFSYSSDKKLITNLNIDVKQGSRVAIVGKTGAGKTTLVNLLMRFYDVNSGEILVDGINVNNISRESLRRNFGMVLQETFLFSDTIANNILYGNPDASREDVIKVAKASGAHGFIRRLPKGYDTVINSSSDNLSQGQKQLLTITRVMLVNPPMLILDEATSSIDTRTELHIQEAFKKIMEGRTTFIIAHRLSTIKEADNIIVMDEGNIVEQGKHEDLLKKKGYYYRLYNSQFPEKN